MQNTNSKPFAEPPRPMPQVEVRQQHTETPEQKAARQAREMRDKMLTREIKAIPVARVFEELFQLAPEKSGQRHFKYSLPNGVMINVEREGQVFGALNGHQFQCLGNKRGSAGAIDAYLVAKEACEGQSVTFIEAREALQRVYFSHTLEASTRKRQSLGIKVGDADWASFFHKGAVIASSSGTELVVEPFSKDKGEVTVVPCDNAGHPVPGAAPRVINEAPARYDFHGAKRNDAEPVTLLKSNHHLIPDGTKSDHPGLLMVPFGPFEGFMIGQLNESQLASVSEKSSSQWLKMAIKDSPAQSFAGQHIEARRKAREAEESKPVTLPPRKNRLVIDGKILDNEAIARKYLTEKRRLPAALVDAALAANSVYPSESKVEAKNPKTGEVIPGKYYHHPALCIPIADLKTGEPIAYQLKVLYQDPELAKRMKGKDSYNFGPVNRGFAMIGVMQENTTDVVLTEAYIDGLSKWSMEKYGPNTVVLATTGTRHPEELLAMCKERGYSVTTANDNDHQGRTVSRKVKEDCERLGIPYKDDVPGPSEIALALRDDERGRERLEETRRLADENRVMLFQQPTKNGWIRVRIDNTAWSSEHVWNLREQDKMERQREKRTDKSVEIEVVNKDWNDMIKGDYRRTFTKDFERDFNERLDADKAAEQVAKEKALEVEAPAGPNGQDKVAVNLATGSAPKPGDKAGQLKEVVSAEVAVTADGNKRTHGDSTPAPVTAPTVDPTSITTEVRRFDEVYAESVLGKTHEEPRKHIQHSGMDIA